jgi:predicted DNA-binding transcriptional regulator AlpA
MSLSNNEIPHVLRNYLTREQLAVMLNKSVRTLDRMHRRRIGPPRTVIGKLVAYRLEGVEDWIRQHEQSPPKRR